MAWSFLRNLDENKTKMANLEVLEYLSSVAVIVWMRRLADQAAVISRTNSCLFPVDTEYTDADRRKTYRYLSTKLSFR